MKIAIQNSQTNFHQGWIQYFKEKDISFKLVDCYQSDIIQQISDCDAFMWHFHHNNPTDIKFAKQLLFSIEASGKKVFPNFNTAWHFDDKLGQKYLLEAINAPFIPTRVFFNKSDAINWLNKTNFPKVFKLRGGAAGLNVSLVKNRKAAIRLVNKSFGRGFSQFNSFNSLKDRWRKFVKGKVNILDVLKGVIRLFVPPEYSYKLGREKGYVYFQDFIPNNPNDTRLIVIGDKAYGMQRLVRTGDFKASGSDEFTYEPLELEIVKVGFQISEKLKLQAVAFDFIIDIDKKPRVVEMSYAFGTKGSSKCTGYWDRNLKWNYGKFNPYGWMVEEMLK